MANDSANDVLMRIMVTENAWLPAECQTEVTRDDDPYVFDYYNGQFFEVTDFTFGMNLEDKTPDETEQKGTITPNMLQAARANLRPVSRGPGAPPPMPTQAGSGAPAGPQSKFARWKSATPEQIKAMQPYEAKMDEFSITRTYDKASPVLFEKCCNSESFASASLVKRVVVGADMLRGILRIDFKEVLLTHVEWQNGDVVKETVKFVCREMITKYRMVVYKPNADPEMRQIKELDWPYGQQLKAPDE